MTAIHGQRGVVDFTGLTFEVVSFSVNSTAEIVESTVMDVQASSITTAHWKSYLTGYKDWNATVEIILPAAGIGITALGTEAALGLDSTDGLDWAGTAICTGISMVNSSDDIGKATLSFEGVAALTAA